VNFDDTQSDIERASSIGAGATDIQAQLAAAATPLEYQATLETKFASYDNYCSLFHYILNSEGPVDLEVPNVRIRLLLSPV
jgi:translation initiation factor 3 subunit L